MKLILTPSATEDLVEIFKYTLETHGRAQAEKYVSLVQEAFEIIHSFPLVGHKRKDLPNIYLAYPVGGHSLFIGMN